MKRQITSMFVHGIVFSKYLTVGWDNCSEGKRNLAGRSNCHHFFRKIKAFSLCTEMKYTQFWSPDQSCWNTHCCLWILLRVTYFMNCIQFWQIVRVRLIIVHLSLVRIEQLIDPTWERFHFNRSSFQLILKTKDPLYIESLKNLWDFINKWNYPHTLVSWYLAKTDRHQDW